MGMDRPRVALVDTVPRNARNQNSVNLGYEIVAGVFDADRYRWFETLKGDYDVIAFNIYYPMHLFNIVPFLTINNIPPLIKDRGGIKVMAGGQGIGSNGILSLIADEVYDGELDLQQNRQSLTSDPVYVNSHSVIELTRGCKRKCKFCDYTYTVKPYREKPIDLAILQLEEAKQHGASSVDFHTMNLAGYSRIDSLLGRCRQLGLSVRNATSCLADMPHLYGWTDMLPKYYRMGIESFDQDTRKRIGKPFSDDVLDHTIDRLLASASYFHFYLIYGLPGDNYESWFAWAQRLAAKRKSYTKTENTLFGAETVSTKNIRFDFSITNFQPMQHTPFANEATVDFRQKDEFIKRWGQIQMDSGLFVGKSFGYANAQGRLGQSEWTYRQLMAIRQAGPEATNALINAYPKGVPISCSETQCRRLLNMLEAG